MHIVCMRVWCSSRVAKHACRLRYVSVCIVSRTTVAVSQRTCPTPINMRQHLRSSCSSCAVRARHAGEGPGDDDSSAIHRAKPNRTNGMSNHAERARLRQASVFEHVRISDGRVSTYRYRIRFRRRVKEIIRSSAELTMKIGISELGWMLSSINV
jgi:hypothetical protein